MTESKYGVTETDSASESSAPGIGEFSRRQLLTAGPALALATPSLSALLLSSEAAGGIAPTDGKFPGYWSPTDPSRPPIDGPKGQDLWRRADKVMPSYAMFLTRSARYAGYNVLPGFIAGAEGCRVTDVDGRSYIDFTGSAGPNLLGYRHPEIEAAARAQADKGDLMPMFSPAMIDFCERLLQWTDDFDWALPLKRGSDATELAMRIARAASGRPHILMFEDSYHGSNREQSLLFEGAPSDALEHLSRLPWNDAAALDNFKSSRGEQVAAILMSPLDQPGGNHVTHFASPEFVAAINRFRKRTGAMVILDDVRAGFRLHPQGSQKAMGLQPDMLCLGKALGNGHGIAALMGTGAARGGAERILYASTYLYSAVCARAGITTLDVYERDNVFATMQRAGERLTSGIQKAAKQYNQHMNFSGPATHPTMFYDNDPDSALMERFCHEAAKRGALFHSRIWSFMSAAHDDACIDEAIDIVEKSFAAMAEA
jgi:glutamate-1-semialdehyde 2,1-aminomutase